MDTMVSQLTTLHIRVSCSCPQVYQRWVKNTRRFSALTWIQNSATFSPVRFLRDFTVMSDAALTNSLSCLCSDWNHHPPILYWSIMMQMPMKKISLDLQVFQGHAWRKMSHPYLSTSMSLIAIARAELAEWRVELSPHQSIALLNQNAFHHSLNFSPMPFPTAAPKPFWNLSSYQSVSANFYKCCYICFMWSAKVQSSAWQGTPWYHHPSTD